MPISKETLNLLDYFKNNKKEMKSIKNINIDFKTIANINIINHLTKLSKDLEQLKFNIQENKNAIDIIRNIIDYLNTFNVIYIPFLGPTNAGKTTIINGIIGKDLLPTGMTECTKRGIIIGYGDLDDNDMFIANMSLEKKKYFNEHKFYFQRKNIIGKGLAQVRDTLNGLNNKFPNSEKYSFYYIKTKIKLYDELGLDKNMKKMIYLIDFPGFGTGNFFENNIYKNIMTICNSFFFIVKNLRIKESNNALILNNLFLKTMDQTNIISSNKFIKSCFFIVNNEKEQTTSDIDLESGKRQIQGIIKNEIEKENINLSFFNAEFYSHFNNYYNYFFDIDFLFKKEYKNFQEYNSNIFKYPEKYISNKKYETFYAYLNTAINNKKKKLFQYSNKNFDNKISAEIENQIKKIVNQNIYYNLDNKEIKILAKYISFSQDNINKLEYLEKSGVVNFKKIFLEQIYFINDEIQMKLNQKSFNIISRLDIFFSDRKEGINEFKNKIKVIKSKLLNLLSQNWNLDIKDNLEKLSKLLDAKNINGLLKKKNYDEIKKEINNDLKQNLIELEEPILNYIDNKINNINLLTLEADMAISNFYLDKNIFKKPKFKEYYIKYFGDKAELSLTGEIYNYIINSSEGLLDILFNNGIIELIKSIFNSEHCLLNIINIIKNNYSNCIKKAITKFSNVAKDYIEENINFLEFILLKLQINYNKEQRAKWFELRLHYEEKRNDILKEFAKMIKALEDNKEKIENEKGKSAK